MSNKVTKEEANDHYTNHQVKVMQAYLDGKRIQRAARMVGADWKDWDTEEGLSPLWNWHHSIYRVYVPPKKPFCADFDVLHSQINFVTMDGNGEVIGWRSRPLALSDHKPLWVPRTPVLNFEAPLRHHPFVELSANGFTGYSTTDLPWKERIAVRPGCVE